MIERRAVLGLIGTAAASAAAAPLAEAAAPSGLLLSETFRSKAADYDAAVVGYRKVFNYFWAHIDGYGDNLRLYGHMRPITEHLKRKYEALEACADAVFAQDCASPGEVLRKQSILAEIEGLTVRHQAKWETGRKVAIWRRVLRYEQRRHGLDTTDDIAST